MATNVTTTELETALNELATGLGLSVKEFVEGGFLDLATYNVDKSAVLARLDAIDVVNGVDGVNTLVEKMTQLDAIFTENGSLATDVLNRITANATATQAVATDLAALDAKLVAEQAVQDANIAKNASDITTLGTTVAANKTASDAADAVLDGRITATEGDLTTLKGDATVVGSVANAVKAEKDRAVAAEAANRTTSDAAIATAKQEAITAAATAATAGDAALQSQIDNLGTASATTDANVAAVQAELDATQAGLGLNADGSFTPVDGTNASESYAMDVAGDANTLKKAVRKVAREAKTRDDALATSIADNAAALAAETAARVQLGTDLAAADVVLDNKIVQEIADRTAGDAALQTQIDGLAGTGTGSLGSLETRVGVVESDLNDTVDGTGALVKGVKSRLTDAEAAIAAETAARTAANTQLDTDLKAYSDANDLKASQMDVCAIGNSFRAALGLGAVNCAATATTTTTTGL